MSERIRLALERHEYIMLGMLVGTSNTIDTKLDVLTRTLEDFDFKDFKMACRAMPSLVKGYLEEEAHELSTEEEDQMVEWLEEAEPRERLHMLDAAIHNRLTESSS